jgi:sec-independent protein translocase protein TatA
VNLGAPELLIVLLVVLVLFGGAKLPKLARSMGQAQSEFKEGLREGKAGPADDEADDKA